MVRRAGEKQLTPADSKLAASSRRDADSGLAADSTSGDSRGLPGLVDVVAYLCWAGSRLVGGNWLLMETLHSLGGEVLVALFIEEMLDHQMQTLTQASLRMCTTT